MKSLPLGGTGSFRGLLALAVVLIGVEWACLFAATSTEGHIEARPNAAALETAPTWKSQLEALLGIEPGLFDKTQSPELVPTDPAAPSAGLQSIAESDLLANVAESVLPSVVNISVRRDPSVAESRQQAILRQFFGPGAPQHSRSAPQRQSVGSGVIVSTDGQVLTNRHVIEGSSAITARLADGREFDARVLGQDEHTDLAVLELIDAHDAGVTPLAFGDTSALRLGELVLAVGNPFGLSGSLSLGIVSAKGRHGMGIADYEDFIQTDAAINPGNSGGALVNLDGQLVGINTAILSRSGGSQGIGFAVPAHVAERVLASLVSQGRLVRGFLGVSIQDLSSELAQTLHTETTRGALVAEVQSDSPADRSGLLPGDVVVAIDEQDIADASDLRTAVGLSGPGTTVSLRVLRDQTSQTITVTLADRDPQDRPGSAESRHGLTVSPAHDPGPLGARRQAEGGSAGLVVMEVAPDSPAQRGGLEAGDVILLAGGEPVSTPAQLWTLWDQARRNLLLRVRKGGTLVYLALPSVTG